MKFRNTILVPALLIAVVFTFSNCKKKEVEKKLSCKLISANVNYDGNTSESYTFSYNNENKVSQISSTSGAYKYTTTLAYSGNLVEIIKREGPSVIEKKTLTLNSADHITRIEERDPENDTLISISMMNYNSNGELINYTTKYSNEPARLTTVVTSNGNITSLASEGDVTTLEYNLSQNWRAGDYVDLIQRIFYGNNFYLFNKNLLKSMKMNGQIVNFNYSYDVDNNITQMETLTNGNTSIITYQHQCE